MSARPQLWRRPVTTHAGLVAAALAAVGEAAAVWLIVDSDNTVSVVWPLVLAPLTFAVLAATVPSRAVKVIAAVCVTLFCLGGLASIGAFFLPAAVALWVAAFRPVRGSA